MITAICFSGIHYRRNNNIYYPDNNTALYARLSQENALDGESSSIANQKIFQRYGNDNGFHPILQPIQQFHA